MSTEDKATEIARRRYDRNAPLYDLMEALVERFRFRKWRELLWSKVEGTAILEVGVGTGKNFPYYPADAEIIKQGYGFAYTKFPFKYLEKFKQYQKEAEENKRGLWRGGGEVELDWLERNRKEPLKLYKMANDLWGIKFRNFIRTRISNDELVPILEEVEALANECHERDLEMELLRKDWKKE